MKADSVSADLAALQAAYAELLADAAAFPAVVRAGRDAAGLTVRRAAAAVGVSHPTWSKWESGSMTPSDAPRAMLGWPRSPGLRPSVRGPVSAAAKRAVREVPYPDGGLPRLMVTIYDRTVAIAPHDAVVSHRLCSVRLAAERARQGTATGMDRAILAANDDERILALALGKTLQRMRADEVVDEVMIRLVGAIAYVWATSGLSAARRHWERLSLPRAADGPGTPPRRARES